MFDVIFESFMSLPQHPRPNWSRWQMRNAHKNLKSVRELNQIHIESEPKKGYLSLSLKPMLS